MLINELSKRTGLSIHTLRYYENYGLIAGSIDETVKSNNYKQYDEILVEKIKWIVESKKAGFTLAEIRKSLNDWFSNKLSSDKKIELVRKKIEEVDSKIQELKQVKKYLFGYIKDIENGDC
jgi:Predicted transcriptional regulators